jgi:hypothetical protein
MGRFPPIPRGAPPLLDIVTAPGIETAPQGQPVPRAMRGAMTHLGIPDFLNPGSWHVDVLAIAPFVDASAWLLFLHILASSDLFQERAEMTFTRLASSLSFRADLSGSFSTLAGIFFERTPHDGSDEPGVQRLANCGQVMAVSENVLAAKYMVHHPPQTSLMALFVGVWMNLLRPGSDAATLVALRSIGELAGPGIVPLWATSSTHRLALEKNLTTSLIYFPCRPQEASCPLLLCSPSVPQLIGWKGRRRYV